MQLLLSDDLIWDQNGFNDLAKNKTGPSVGEDGLFWAYRQNLKMGILPVSLFCSGHTYFIQVALLLKNLLVDDHLVFGFCMFTFKLTPAHDPAPLTACFVFHYGTNLWTSGKQELYKKLDLVPYAVHTTFQFGGTEGKRHRLREAKLFYDPPEYFDTPGTDYFISEQYLGAYSGTY